MHWNLRTDTYIDTFIVYRRYQLSPVRHPIPFNKTQRGKARRAERKFKLQQLVEGIEAERALAPDQPLHRKKVKPNV
jgi:hypothetical protein